MTPTYELRYVVGNVRGRKKTEYSGAIEERTIRTLLQDRRMVTIR
jgi:hypothetical protein